MFDIPERLVNKPCDVNTIFGRITSKCRRSVLGSLANLRFSDLRARRRRRRLGLLEMIGDTRCPVILEAGVDLLSDRLPTGVWSQAKPRE